ncbi:MAG: hypothetical protein KAS23_02630 [Anaerohalosphaera sp.]|nr:hypothetical protein [Anaerohalosphaera sp.]
MLVLLVCGAAVESVSAAQPGGRRRQAGEMPGQMPPDMMMPGMMPGMPGMMPGGMGQQVSNGEVSKSLTELFKMINTGQVPDNKKIAGLKKTILENKPPKKPRKQDVCLYYMLRAWTSYYDGDETMAMQLSSNAVRNDAANKDALKTDAAIKVLTGNADSIKTSVKAKPANAQSNYNEFGAYGGQSIQGDLLDLDVESIRKDMIGKKVGTIQATCVNGTLFGYKPGESPLCVVFWQAEDNVDLAAIAAGTESEPNGFSKSTRRTNGGQRRGNHAMMGPGMMMPGMMPGMPGMPGMMPGGMGGYGPGSQKMDPTAEQMYAFGDIFAERIDSGVKFLAINTDSFMNKSVVLDTLLENGWPWAQVMIEGVGMSMGLDQFADFKVEVSKPFMIITDAQGVIKYAGNASGFLSDMVLDKYAGQVGDMTMGMSIDMSELGGDAMGEAMAKAIAEAMAQAMSEGMDEMMNQGGMTQTPVVEVESVEPKKPVREVAVEDSTEITADEFQAQKMYEVAKLEVKTGVKLGSARKGVALCRDILRKYPDSASADKARSLLRGLPDRFKKRYKITKKEMGL